MRISSKLIVIFIILFITGVAVGVALFIKPAIGPGPTTKEPQEFKNVILIGWDGTERSVLKSLLAEGKLPNLNKIIKDGVLVDIDITTGVTETKPGWAEILTGYDSRNFGIVSNTDYRPIPLSYTIFERLENHFGRENIATVFLGGKLNNIGDRGPHKICINCLTRYPKTFEKTGWWEENTNAPTASGEEKIFVSREGEPYYYSKNSLDLYLTGLGEAKNVGEKALGLLEQYKDGRFFMFIHFEEPDEPGHIYSGESKEYKQGIVTDDYWLGKIIKHLKKLGVENKTLVYIASDHGFDPKGRGHKNAPAVFLATNDKRVKKNGGRIDITPTILDAYGINLGTLSPPLTGKSLFEE